MLLTLLALLVLLLVLLALLVLLLTLLVLLVLLLLAARILGLALLIVLHFELLLGKQATLPANPLKAVWRARRVRDRCLVL